MNLRNLNIFHVWPSVKEDCVIQLSGDIINVPKGNWDAPGLALYLTQQSALGAGHVTVTYDYAQLKFLFSPAATIGPLTTNFHIVGFPNPPPLFNFVSESPQPVQLSGPTRIHVNTNLSLYTVPTSGRLGTVPVTVDYGELLSYFDESGTEPSLCMEQHIDHLDIKLTDENNNPLEGYEDVPWGVIISITPVVNEGFDQVPYLKQEDGTIVQEDAVA